MKKVSRIRRDTRTISFIKIDVLKGKEGLAFGAAILAIVGCGEYKALLMQTAGLQKLLRR